MSSELNLADLSSFSFVVFASAQLSLCYTHTLMLPQIHLPSNHSHPLLSSLLPPARNVLWCLGLSASLQVSALAPLDPAVGRARRIKRVCLRSRLERGAGHFLLPAVPGRRVIRHREHYWVRWHWPSKPIDRNNLIKAIFTSVGFVSGIRASFASGSQV